MSFILDALKKSEQERERQQQPTVVDIPYGRRNRAQPLWMLAVIALLVLNCVLLVVMWWRSGDDNNPPSPPPPSMPATDITAAAPGVDATPARTTTVRPLQEEAGEIEAAAEDEAAAALDDATPSGPPLVRPTTPLEQAVAQQQARANELKANSENRQLGIHSDPGTIGNLPTLASLGGNGALNLPELRLEIHVYSSVPAERFAFINSRKYSEGQTLTEGPQVERITQDGVVLAHRGKRFVLPRQ